ncbi:hypothetical protein GQ600_6332 [Phytophthora cactorum]|nr:hypothetical protein GQ600_6332 [Phytophthora cactorum]
MSSLLASSSSLSMPPSHLPHHPSSQKGHRCSLRRWKVPSKSMNRPNVNLQYHPQPRDKQTHLRLVSWSKVHANSAPGMPRAWTLDGDVDEHVRYQSIFVEAAWWEPAIWLNLFSKQELSFGKYWDARLLGEPKLFGMLLRMETLATTFSSLRPNGYHIWKHRFGNVFHSVGRHFWQWIGLMEPIIWDIIWTHSLVSANPFCSVTSSLVVTRATGRGIPVIDFVVLGLKAVTMENIVDFFKSKNPSRRSLQAIVIDKYFVA